VKEFEPFVRDQDQDQDRPSILFRGDGFIHWQTRLGVKKGNRLQLANCESPLQYHSLTAPPLRWIIPSLFILGTTSHAVAHQVLSDDSSNYVFFNGGIVCSEWDIIKLDQ